MCRGQRGSRFYLFVTQEDHEARARHLNISTLARTLPCGKWINRDKSPCQLSAGRIDDHALPRFVALTCALNAASHDSSKSANAA